MTFGSGLTRSSPPSTSITIYHIHHKRPSSRTSFQALDTVYPDGYCLFRTDSVLSERMQDIRGVPGVSIYITMQFPSIRKNKTSIQFYSAHTLQSLTE